MPDPIAWFFSPRRHAINAYDVYGRIIESLDGLQARLRYGGDAAMLGLPQARRPNVKVQTVDLFNAPVALDTQGAATIPLRLPDFNGTLRLAAVAYAEQQYGAGEREIIVQAPLVVEASAPRAMASGDSAELALDLDNLSGADGSYEVMVDGGEFINVANGKRNLKLADGDRTTLSFPLSARQKFGIAKVQITVRGKDVKVDRSIEFAPVPDSPVMATSGRKRPASATGRSMSKSRRNGGTVSRAGVDPCHQARAKREQALERLGLKRTFADLSRLDEPVRAACRW